MSGVQRTAVNSMIACVSVPALPLQLVLAENPDWVEDPVVVVEEDKPLASILWVNRQAQALAIRRGMRFREAKSMTSRLRAQTVPDLALTRANERILQVLLRVSPKVEPSERWSGIFWVDPAGLQRLFGTSQQWVDRVLLELQKFSFQGSVVLGFSRYATFALARSSSGAHVMPSREKEQNWAHKISLQRLNLDPRLLEEMMVLGVRTLGDLKRLPRADLRLRYGEEAEALHRLITDQSWVPLKGKLPVQSICEEIEVNPPDDNITRLIFGMKRVVHRVVERLNKRCEAVAVIRVKLFLEHKESLEESIETAHPTLDVVQLVDLLRLRFSKRKLSSRVHHIRIVAESVRVHLRQAALWQAKKGNAEAASRGLARVKAIWGSTAVTRMVLQKGILPEARFRGSPIVVVQCPEAFWEAEKSRPRVRRMLLLPTLLPEIPKYEPERWLGHHGAVEQMWGPYRINGGWWAKRVTRDYYFIETKMGEVLWVYYDGVRRRWFLQGITE